MLTQWGERPEITPRGTTVPALARGAYLLSAMMQVLRA